MSQSFPSTTLVIFGVTGDLSKRYLIPALSAICQNSDTRAQLNILGVSRRPVQAKDVLKTHHNILANQFSLLQMDYGNKDEYQKLRAKLEEIKSEQVIFYLVVPPEAVLPIIHQLGEAKLNGPKYRLLIEKPFGTNLESAIDLISQTNKFFNEEQVYRIDHYLAKEMAQNVTVFLGSNALFRDVWSNQFIDKIEIVAEESIGVEGRGNFYEQTGALLDFVQSHLLQLAALTLMEPCPDVFDFSQVQSRRLAALNNLDVDNSRPVVKAQYEGYAKEVANPESTTETFVSLTLKSNHTKWKGVPIELVTGKKLSKRLTEIRVHFKKSQAAQTNLLKLRIQPEEAIELELWVKKPGYEQDLQKLPLDFSYQRHFDSLPNAYEQVIVDAIRSRTNLFASSSEVLASWKILQPILDDWSTHHSTPKLYKSGSTVTQILST
ncbi:glucose-6-phosphate dehydrogenase (NADP(+)) [Candidatus Saccharibacteria bacterium]|nr:glucose-6-phosphate dehydrogenase (NADP(+)) [Candidatus Saccharibacteria bacterium]